jgi:uncharacterized protein YxeA
MKKILATALFLIVLVGPAFVYAKHPPKPLHKNAPHPYTKHHADKHPATVHPQRVS